MNPEPIDMEEATNRALERVERAKSCWKCKHFDIDSWSCPAFPKADDLPYDFLIGVREHTKPEPGDHGIQFEPKEK